MVKKSYKTRFARFLTEENVQFAEKKHKAAQLNNFKKIVTKAVLIKMTQKKIRSAQNQYGKNRKSIKKIKLKKKVISGLNSISCIKKKMKRHNLLLN